MIAEEYAEEINNILARFPQRKSAVLHLMHLAQREYGYMSGEAMREIADILEIDPTHVLSLAGFYSLFYEEPTGRYVLEICNDLACALRGADEFVEMACGKLDVSVDGTTEDGLFTVKMVMCLGACDRAPMLQCNLKFEEHLDEEKFDALLARLREEAGEDSVSDSNMSEAVAKQGSVVDKMIAFCRD